MIQVKKHKQYPNMKLNGPTINGDHTTTKFDSNSQVMNWLKPHVGELQQQT